jgi:TolB-like protein
MKPILTITLCISILLGLIAGCSKEIKDTDLVSASYSATDALLKVAREIENYPNKPILIASFVDVDNVQHSSTLGRTLAEQMGSRVSQHGYKVIEVKLRTNSVFVRGTKDQDEGEFMLSRELQDISFQHDAHAVLVGTYGKGPEVVYITAKLVRTKDSVILGSYDFSLPVGKNTKKMLQ